MQIKNIKLLDSTLREGKQSILSNFLLRKENKFLEIISQIGIREVEINNPFLSSYWLGVYEKLITRNLPLKVFVHTRVRRENLDLLVKLPKVKYLSVFVEKKDVYLKKGKIMLSKCLKEFLKETKLRKMKIRVGIEDSFFLPPKRLVELYKNISEQADVIRVGLLDTYGYITPEVLLRYVTFLDQNLAKEVEIELHLHNDVGLAASNFYHIVSNIKTDRKLVFSVSFAGIGERNGILSYGEVFSILYLKSRDSLIKRYNLSAYHKISELLFGTDNILNYRDPLSYNSFIHAATSHIVNLWQGHSGMGIINPKDFGYDHSVSIGEVTGRESIALVAKYCFGLELDQDKVMTIIGLIKKKIVKDNRRNMSIEELGKLIKQHLKV